MQRTLWLVIPLAVAACTPAPISRGLATTAPAATPRPKASVAARPKDTTLIMGRVLAPSGIIAAGGGNMVAAGAGNMVAAGAGNLITDGGSTLVAAGAGNAVGGRRLLGLTQAPLAGTEVFLADAAGEPYPGIAPVTTNRNGQYEFAAVPKGYTYKVVARCRTAAGKPAQLQNLAKAGELGATANLDMGSTMVTTSILTGATGGLGEIDVDQLKRAIAQTGERLDGAKLPDLADPAAMLAAMRELEGAVAELRTELGGLRRAVGELRASVAELDGKIAALAKQLPAVSPLVPDNQALTTAKLPISIAGQATVTLYLRALDDAPPLPADVQLRVALVTPDYPPAYAEQRVTAGAGGGFSVTLGRDARQTIVYFVTLYDAAMGDTPIVADLYVDAAGQVDVDNERYVPYALSLTP